MRLAAGPTRAHPCADKSFAAREVSSELWLMQHLSSHTVVGAIAHGDGQRRRSHASTSDGGGARFDVDLPGALTL